SDFLPGVSAEIGREPIVFEIIGNEDGHSTRDEQVGSGEEIPVVEFPFGHQVTHGQFHDLKRLFLFDVFLLAETLVGAAHDIDVRVADGTETAPLDKDGLLPENLGWLQNFPSAPNMAALVSPSWTSFRLMSRLSTWRNSIPLN